MVSLGAAIFTVVSAYGFTGIGADPTRIAAQIVSGIGFIGAGTIIQSRGGSPGPDDGGEPVGRGRRSAWRPGPGCTGWR